MLEHIGMNNYVIQLEEGKSLCYGLNYRLRPIDLKTLKIYIEAHLKTEFIRLSKSPVRVPILFHQK